MEADARRPGLLTAILVASILSTGLHYTHNYLAIDDYPPAGWVSQSATQVAVLVSWPVLTAIGIAGYRLYRQGRMRIAHACLVAYSFTGIATLGHFLYGTPHIPAFFYATIFTDAITGLSMLAFAIWSIRATGRAAPRSPGGAAHAA
jgi:hypothetical protein